jgi:hypothetical protein
MAQHDHAQSDGNEGKTIKLDSTADPAPPALWCVCM